VTPLEAIAAWRAFATSLSFNYRGQQRSWADHVRSGAGYVDEVTLIQPIVFPAFARELLGFQLGQTLAAETSDTAGKPDFTPADSVTHPFVFETKGTSEGSALTGHDTQIRRYLVDGRPRIRSVVLTNLVGLQVFALDDQLRPVQTLKLNLLELLEGDQTQWVGTAAAQRLARFFDEYRWQDLSREQRVERLRLAPPWRQGLEVTDPAWMSGRLDEAVEILKADVSAQIDADVLDNPAIVSADERDRVILELQHLETRLGASPESAAGRTLSDYLGAGGETSAGKAVRQYEAHVAYYAATRLLLVRIWEDLELLDPVLYDGGFDRWMQAFDDVVGAVVRHSFDQARGRYRSLFDQQNAYTWYAASDDAYVDSLYQLANTYFGELRSDILGVVYERLLERIDRKLLGQYYTPRDIIALIWDLIDVSVLAERAEQEGRTPRVFDIATGSAGFLVEAARRMRERYEAQLVGGASVDLQTWLNSLCEGLTGVEIQRFPAYLAELNVLIQVGTSLRGEPAVRIPSIGILATDSLSLHNPSPGDAPLVMDDRSRQHLAETIQDPSISSFDQDAACGNPPYIGEKAGGRLLQLTREAYPYWNQYVGQHPDYLYWFLILGISKLRQGGRFGFITTEYWLRAAGGRVLREYVARRCRVEHILLFRDFRLFPDAPGQHSMVIVGERVAPPDWELDAAPSTPDSYPTVSIYGGSSVRGAQRELVLSALRDGRSASGVRTFRAGRAPNGLLGESWAEVVMPSSDVRRRERVRRAAEPLALDIEEGVLSSADALRGREVENTLPRTTLVRLGWPERKAGVFVLQPDEFQALGPLNQAEKQCLRPMINTRDVLPYASVIPTEPERMLYLPRPTELEGRPQAEVRAAPFPQGLPQLERHLVQFRPYLEDRVERYGERRPWWTIHRPRPRTVSRADTGQTWADYCVTTRWGSGERLTVGLAPDHALPQSGLHALLPPDGVPAAYLSGLLNSTPVQDLASTLPPGQIRTSDLEQLGLPLIDQYVAQVSLTATELADAVTTLARTWALRFPKLLDALREDIALGDVPDDAWLPTGATAYTHGELHRVSWVTEVIPRGAQSSRATGVSTEATLFGHEVVVHGSESQTLTVRVAEEESELRAVLTAYVTGLIAVGTKLRDVAIAPVPIASAEFVRAFEDDQQGVHSSVDSFRSNRRVIDDIVATIL